MIRSVDSPETRNFDRRQFLIVAAATLLGGCANKPNCELPPNVKTRTTTDDYIVSPADMRDEFEERTLMPSMRRLARAVRQKYIDQPGAPAPAGLPVNGLYGISFEMALKNGDFDNGSVTYLLKSNSLSGSLPDPNSVAVVGMTVYGNPDTPKDLTENIEMRRLPEIPNAWAADYSFGDDLETIMTPSAEYKRIAFRHMVDQMGIIVQLQPTDTPPEQIGNSLYC